MSDHARVSPGRERLSRHLVMEIQRARILAAAVDAAHEVGYEQMTVTALIQQARISRKTFYDIFANIDECYEAVVEDVFARAQSVANAAYAVEDGWLAAIRSALNALLCLIDEEPHLAKIWFVDAASAPEAVRKHKTQAMAVFAAVVDLGRATGGEQTQPPPLTAEAIVGGIAQIIRTRLVTGSQEPFVELLGLCMYLIALPYLGVEQATAELRRELPGPRTPRAAGTQRDTESPRDMGLLLTYRTVRVLDAISGQPGASNRIVAEESGIKDQGQASKLLWRLERLAVIENRGPARERGASNAWHITARGLKIMQATNAPKSMGVHGTA